MGVNYFFLSKNKNAVQDFFGESYQLTDTPEFGYRVHIAKASAGWLPLFQAHEKCRSIDDIHSAYNSGEFRIIDDSGEEYSWSEFDKEVLHHNGGIDGAIPKRVHRIDRSNSFVDPDMPDHTPVSHFEYGKGKYTDQFFKDPKGYEFSKGDFR